LGALISYHTLRGHSLLLGSCKGGGTAAGRTSFFINLSTGRPLKPEEPSNLFTKEVLQGTGCKFGPQTCRSIYVCGSRDMQRQQQQASSSSTSRGAAMVMGNGLEVWDSVYDRFFHHRHACEAMQGMAAWRQGMLMQGKLMQQASNPSSTSAARGGL
jgi:hypothetical protein